jgi:glycine dehydrogenase subunit 1
MRYIPNAAADQESMLRELGLGSLEELFQGVPKDIRLTRALALPPAMSEPELIELFQNYARRNAGGMTSFLGAGVNEHFIPTVIDSLISRGEFLTSYTPYQPELAQGTLQAIFEFQTFMCQLTAMEVSNASLYDGSTALTEAVLMGARVNQRNRLLVASAVHPEYRAVVATTIRQQGFNLDLIGYSKDGRIDVGRLEAAMGDDVAAIVVQSPNFFGNLEPIKELAELAHQRGALLIVAVAEALSLGIVSPPGEAGADIVCGEAQSLGVPASFGGPHVGFLCCREKFLRNLPGRLAGQTVDLDGKRGFVLTLSTREQHIRREKATSNICTNQNLIALMSTIYCSLLGKVGLREVALQNVAKTQYALSELQKTIELKVLFEATRFNEFVVQLPYSYDQIASKALSAGFIPGLLLERYYPELKNCLLISVTETKKKVAIDRLIHLLEANH